MTLVATGNAIEALVDAVKTHLDGDAELGALVTGVYGFVPAASRQTHPYVRIGSQAILQDDFGAMQTAGGRVVFTLDSWSAAKGPHTMRTVLARLLVLLERVDLTLAFHVLAGGSLHCTLSGVDEEPDEDMPDRVLYHGRQEWEALVEEM